MAAKKFEVMGKHANLDGRALAVGDVIEDERDLDKLFVNKYRRVKKKAKPAPAEVDPVDLDIEDDDEEGDDGAVHDGGPSQPTAADGSLNQRVTPETVKGADAVPPKGKGAKVKGKADAPKDEGKPEYENVTENYPKAKKADLVVFEYPDNSFQVFDADDVDNPDAVPVNETALKTSAQLNKYLDTLHQ
jgi:hypothetical protein